MIITSKESVHLKVALVNVDESGKSYLNSKRF